MNDVSNGTFDIDDYIAARLGPKSVDLSVSLPITVVYCCVWVCGMAGKT